tara:strand:- start:203 stop:424 length:222 start_codon:yes stop_codon:yes gene_type:complete
MTVKRPRTFKFTTEIVNGACPECFDETVLIGINERLYRCTSCGETLEQKVNGVIKYMTVDKNTRMTMREEDGA